MQEMTQGSSTEQLVFQAMIDSGWQETAIFRNARFSDGSKTLSPDFFLTYDLYPFAIVEVKTKTDRQWQEAKQSWLIEVARANSIPFIVIADGESTLVMSNSSHATPLVIGHFPPPRELWELLGREWNDMDPRLSAPCSGNKQVEYRWYHTLAVSRVVDAVLAGQMRVWVQLAQGSGKTYVLMQIIWKLLTTQTKQRALVLVDRIELQSFLATTLSECLPDISVVIANRPSNTYEDARVVVATVHSLEREASIAEGAEVGSQFNPTAFDLVVLDDIAGVRILQDLVRQNPSATYLAISGTSTAATTFSQAIDTLGKPRYVYSIEGALNGEPPEVPAGFRTAKLSDIAEISIGSFVGQRSTKVVEELGDKESEHVNLKALTARAINEDGTIDWQRSISVPRTKTRPRDAMRQSVVKHNDILVARISGRYDTPIGFITEKTATNFVMDRSLIRIRITVPDIRPHEVFQFFRSAVGQNILRRFVPSTAVFAEATMLLAEMPVFIPMAESTVVEIEKKLGASEQAIHRIENWVLPLLKGGDEADGSESDRHEEAAKLMRDIASQLVPPRLEEKVITEYPTPIALAYRKLLDARYNAFEQVRRLIDVAEAMHFFVYNIVLADVLQRPRCFYVKDSGARRAYRGYSMAARMDFVKAIQEIAVNGAIPLFVSELADSFDASAAKEITDQLRNRMAHTATAPEAYQKKLVETFLPKINEALEKLDYICSYQLMRIPSFAVRNGRIHYQMHVYKGANSSVQESNVPLDQIPHTDSEHLILVNPSRQTLDLYPLFQLVSSEETRFEPHICFLKQVKQNEGSIEGESIHGAQLQLDGYAYFEDLQSRITSEPIAPVQC